MNILLSFRTFVMLVMGLRVKAADRGKEIYQSFLNPPPFCTFMNNGDVIRNGMFQNG